MSRQYPELKGTPNQVEKGTRIREQVIQTILTSSAPEWLRETLLDLMVDSIYAQTFIMNEYQFKDLDGIEDYYLGG